MQQMGMPVGPMTQPWLAPQMMGMSQAPQKPPQAPKQVEQPKEEVKAADASSGMIDVLANSTNPKHRQSEFLGFLRQVETGALTIAESGGVSKLEVDAAKMDEY